MIQTIRGNIFWLVDSLRGRRINAHYKRIESIMSNLDSEESKYQRSHSLNRLLTHAVKTTPYYKKFHSQKGLEDFTVIDKNVIRDNYENFKSDKYKGEKNYSVYTSGSTGTPFKLLHDKNKRDRNSADVIYFAQKAGYQIGHKLYYIRHWDEFNSPKPWVARLKNFYMHPVSKLSKSDIDALFKKLSKDTSIKGIMCYASVLHELKIYLQQTQTIPIVKNVRSIIAISEALNEDAKLSLEKFFNTPIVSRYSNVENGILAQQEINSNEFQINWASYYIEILDFNTNTPVQPGDLGRIVITDLFNYCMPMIRYDTGDIGVIASNNGGRKEFLLKRVEGRKLDFIYNTKGEMLSPFIVYNILKYPYILQYQFIQKTKIKYLIKLNVLPHFDSAENIKSEFRDKLGKDAIIELEFVENIPLLSSGKRKFVINEFQKNLKNY